MAKALKRAKVLMRAEAMAKAMMKARGMQRGGFLLRSNRKKSEIVRLGKR